MSLFMGTYPNSGSTMWEYAQAIDTTGTGPTGDIFIPPACKAISVTVNALSTASVTLQVCNCPQKNIDAGTGIWVNSGAAITAGAAVVTAFPAPPHSLRVLIGTALAGVQAAISIVGRE
jgi:hypothetical protein